MSVSPQLKKKKDVKLIRWKGTSESIKETKGARGTLSRSRATSGTERAGLLSAGQMGLSHTPFSH